MQHDRVVYVFESQFQQNSHMGIREFVVGYASAPVHLDDSVRTQQTKCMGRRRFTEVDGCSQITNTHRTVE